MVPSTTGDFVQYAGIIRRMYWNALQNMPVNPPPPLENCIFKFYHIDHIDCKNEEFSDTVTLNREADL